MTEMKFSDIYIYLSNAIPEMGIEGSGGEYDLREHGGGGDGAVETDASAVSRDAMQRLRPPLVGGDVEARDGGCRVDELLDLLVEREARDEVVDSGADGKLSVAERK